MALRALLLILLAALLSAQESTATLENPFTSDADIARGERAFLSQCASCHGRGGRGTSAAPDLSTGQFRRASTDEGLYKIISQGIPGTTMPAFALNPGPTWQVVAYIRSLGRERRNASLPGDAKRGAELFAKNCRSCHDSFAPPLAGITAKRSLDELRTAIYEPDRDVRDAYWRVRVATRDGKTHAGLRLNEDTFTIQMRDAQGVLRSFDRAALSKVEYDRSSPMPSFRGKLAEGDLNDLISHIATLEAQ